MLCVLSKLGHFSLKWFFSRRACNGWTETLKLCQLFYQRSCCNMFLCKLGHFSLKMIIFLIVPAVAGLKPLNFGLLLINLPTIPLQCFLMRARPFSLKIIFSRHTCDGMNQTLELCQLFYQLRHQNMFLSELVHFLLKMIFFSTYLRWHYLIPWTLDYCQLFYQLHHRNAFLSKLGYFLLKRIFFSSCLWWDDSNLWTLDYCQIFYQLHHCNTSLSKLGHFSLKIIFCDVTAMAGLKPLNLRLLSIILPTVP